MHPARVRGGFRSRSQIGPPRELIAPRILGNLTAELREDIDDDEEEGYEMDYQ